MGAHVLRVAASGIGVTSRPWSPPADCAGNLQEFKSCYLELYKPHVEAAAREHGRRFMDADGIMVNRVTQLEPGLLAAINEGRCVPPLYPIGPVLNLGVKDASDDEACVRGSTCSHGCR